MFNELTDSELAELQAVVASGEDKIYAANWLRNGRNQKAAYQSMARENRLIATELAGVRAARKWE